MFRVQIYVPLEQVSTVAGAGPGIAGPGLAMTPDESWLAVAEIDGSLSVFPVDTSTGAVGESAASIPDSHATGVAFSDNSTQIVASSLDNDVVRVYTFDAATGAITMPAAREFPVYRRPNRIAVADLNEDGIVSIISSCHAWATCSSARQRHT